MNSNLLTLLGVYLLVIFTNNWSSFFPTDMINSFNNKMLYITKQYEYICLNLMKEVYDANLFQNTNIHTNGNENRSLMSSIKTFFEPLYFTTDSIVSYFYNDNNNILTATSDLNNELYMLSNVYCLNTFHLHIDIDETNVKQLLIVGDNLDYYWLLQWIQMIEQNIHSNTYLFKNVNPDILTSIKERLTILQQVIHKLQLFVYYSFNKTIHSHDVNYTHTCLNEILNQLDFMLVDIQKFFPIQENEKRKMLELVKQKQILNELDYNITFIEKQQYVTNVKSVVSDTFKFVTQVAISPIVGVVEAICSHLNDFVFSRNGLLVTCICILIAMKGLFIFVSLFFWPLWK